MQHNPSQTELVKMPEKLDETQMAKLPRWAREYITELRRTARNATTRYNSHQASQTATRISSVDRYKAPLFVPDSYADQVTFDLTPPMHYNAKREEEGYSPRDWVDLRIRQGPDNVDDPAQPMSVEIMASRRLVISAHASNVLWVSTSIR